MVDGCCKWDASIQYLSRLEISTGMRSFHLQNCSVNYRASLELVGVQDGGGNAANETRIFHSEIPFGNFGLPVKKFRFPVEISVREEKNGLPIYIPSEISGFFGEMVNNLSHLYQSALRHKQQEDAFSRGIQ